jgi:hypothetical protein
MGVPHSGQRSVLGRRSFVSSSLALDFSNSARWWVTSRSVIFAMNDIEPLSPLLPASDSRKKQQTEQTQNTEMDKVNFDTESNVVSIDLPVHVAHEKTWERNQPNVVAPAIMKSKLVIRRAGGLRR